jgi:hypothetical protein
MNPSPPWNHWDAQAPSEDFADRVTAAVLRDRRTPRRQAVLRWRPFLAVAACLAVAGVAWAWNAVPRNPHADPSLSQLVPVERVDPTPVASPRGPDPSAIRSPARTSRSARPATPRAVAASPSTAPAPPPHIPPCACNAFACDCGPD